MTGRHQRTKPAKTTGRHQRVKPAKTTGRHQRIAPEIKARHQRVTPAETNGSHPGNRRTLTFRRLPVVIALLGLLILGTVIQVGSRVLRTAGALAAPTQFIALALDSPTSIPTQVPPSGPVRFTFTISSTRTKTVAQRWVVSVAATSVAAHAVLQGEATVRPDAHDNIPVSLSIPTSETNITVTISAPGQHLAPLEFHLNSSEDAGSS